MEQDRPAAETAAHAERDRARIVRLLRGLGRAARDSSLTSQLAESRELAVRQYNAILARLVAGGHVDSEFFAPLPDDAPFDAVGLAALQLTEFLQDDEERRGRRRDFETEAVHLGANVGRAIQEQIGEFGELFREHLPEAFRGRKGAAKEGSGAEDAAPESRSTSAVEELRKEMADLLSNLRRSQLTLEDEQREARRLLELAEQHLRHVEPPPTGGNLADELAI